MYSLLPATHNLMESDTINAVSNTPNANLNNICSFTFNKLPIDKFPENWPLLPNNLILDNDLIYKFTYPANKINSFNLENLYSGWNLNYKIISSDLGNNTITI
jgi:hypothetical protein